MIKSIFILISLICLSFTGCISATVAGYGVFDLDPGVRIYESDDITIINITHKEGEPVPSYQDISLILKECFANEN